MMIAGVVGMVVNKRIRSRIRFCSMVALLSILPGKAIWIPVPLGLRSWWL